MANLKMPKIDIHFLTSALSAADVDATGKVVLILRDSAAALKGQSFWLSAAVDIPSQLSADNKAYVSSALIGGVRRPKLVGIYVLPLTDEQNGENFQTALAWCAKQDFSWICPPLQGAAADCDALKAWVKTQRSENDAICKAVLPSTAADSEAVVIFATETVETAAGTLTDKKMCARIAGILCGTPLNQSATYTVLPEATDCTRLSKTARDAAVSAGKLIAFHDGKVVRLGMAVNSLTTVGELTDAYKKIKLIALMDALRWDLRHQIADQYIGKLPNTYDNKLLLVTAINAAFRELAADGVIAEGFSCDIDTLAQRSWLQDHGVEVSQMTEQQIRQAQTGNEVFLVATIAPIDAIENVTLPIHI